MRQLRPLIALLALVVPTPAGALEPPPAAASAMAVNADSGSVRSKADGWMIPPGKTATLGLEFAFLTARGPLDDVIGNPDLRLTDVVLLRLQGRYSLGGLAELIVDTTLLPKQPSYTNELILQNAGFGFRIGLTDWMAAALRFDGGSTMAKSGAWGQATFGLEGRFPIDKYVQFDLSLAGVGTSLFIGDEAPRFFEIGSGGQVVFFFPKAAGVWLGTSFHFPIAHEPTTNWPIDPRVRVGVNLGTVLTAIPKWDLYMKYSVVDRGDLVDLDTILPILDGGFDQQVLTFGIVRRFGDEPSGNY